MTEREEGKHSHKLHPEGTVKSGYKISKNVKSDAKYCEPEPKPNRERTIALTLLNRTK